MTFDKTKFGEWNLRRFPLELQIECQVRAKKERKREPRWLAEILCDALGLSRERYVDSVYSSDDVPGSPNEIGKEEIRYGSKQTHSPLGKAIRRKARART